MVAHCRGGEKTSYLTAEQFMKFLNQEQRDPRLNEILYPYCDVKKSQQLIDQFDGRPGGSHGQSLSQSLDTQQLPPVSKPYKNPTPSLQINATRERVLSEKSVATAVSHHCTLLHPNAMPCIGPSASAAARMR